LTFANGYDIVCVAGTPAERGVKMMSASTEQRGAIYFLTEQACCLVLAQGTTDTDDFRVCRESVEYLTGGDAMSVEEFLTRTGVVKGDPGGLADYDTEEYDRKKRDMLAAVSALARRYQDPATPEDIRPTLLKAADLVASFYGAENALEAALAQV